MERMFLIDAIINSNETRKDYLTEVILKCKPKVVGIYRLLMKSNSDNFREAAVHGIIERLQKSNVAVIIYEPLLKYDKFQKLALVSDIEKFKAESDIVLANRTTLELEDISKKVFTRDIFGLD